MFLSFMNYLKSNKIKIIVILFFSLFGSFLCEQFLFSEFDSFKELFLVDFTGIFFARYFILFYIFIFLGLHWLFPIKVMYNWIFSKRYWLALIILLYMTLNQYSGSSIAMFDHYIQQGQGSEYSEPIFGEPRAIRSDEWLVSTPNRLSAQFGENPYSKYNYIMRATQTPNIAVSNNMYFNYSSIANPFNIAIFLFGQSYGQSFLWYGTIILTFLISIEMCMIISKKNKLISVMGAMIIVFSGFYQWWSYVTWILGAQAALVCGYHFIQIKSKKYKVLLSVGLAISLAYFVTILYPAWQVPVGYLFLGLLIWVIIENWLEIKKFDKVDWIILISSFIFASTIIISYLQANMDYINGIMTTVYPGKRISTGGGDSIHKMFWWFYNPLFCIPGSPINVPSESGSFMTFFPIPLILSFWYLIKERQKDLFTIIIIIVSFFLGSYIVLGWPELVSHITLMSYSTSQRAVDVLMFSQVYLLVGLLSRFRESLKMPSLLAGVVIGGTIPIYILFNLQKFPEVGIPTKYILLVSCLFCLFSMGIMIKTSKKIKQYIIVCITISAFLTGAFVHPIQKGFDVIYSKPLSKEIHEIVRKNPNGKWISVVDNTVTQQFLLANGAPTINSTNIMPNLELWHLLDPNRKYNDVYNRYAHVNIELIEGETRFELLFPDSFKLYLSYEDIPTVGISYIYAQAPLEKEKYSNISFKKIYSEGNNYIYEVNY